MKIIYTDNNATTRVVDDVVKEMLPYLGTFYGNPSSMHTFGGDVGKAIKAARERVAKLIDAKPEEIIFTSCGSESDNAAILSVLKSNPNKKHIITSTVEHPAVLNLCQHLAKSGYRVTYVPVDKAGMLDEENLYKSLDNDTALVTLMWANNETGVLFPIERISQIVKARGILFHTDAVQAAGKVPVTVKNTGIDFLSLSGHKIHAPKGVGVLYARNGTPFHPLLIGGHQEKGRRAGTENVPSIIALGKACELAGQHLFDMNTRVRKLRDKLEEEIIKKISQCRVNGDLLNRTPNTANIGFDGVEGEAILLMMNEHGICASSGSACTSGSLEPSHVLRAMQVPAESVQGAIRFSLSVENTEDDINTIIKILPPIIAKLREMSPFWKK